MELSNTEADLAPADLPVWLQLTFIVFLMEEAMNINYILTRGGFF